MARFTQGGGSGVTSELNFSQSLASPVSVTGYPTTIASLSMLTNGRPVQISVTGEGANDQAGSWVKLNLYRDGQPIGNAIQIEASAVSENVPYAINFIDEVDAGEHTYEAIIYDMSAGNWQFGEVSGPVMNAVELNGFGNSGGSADLSVPVYMTDDNGANFITFERTGTNAARILTNQDDLSLRSARDITLYAGNDGPGNVYIGWGDAVYTPDSPNRVATIGDIESSPKTWTASNDALYTIRQAHGGAEITLDQPSSYGDVVSAEGNVLNGTTILVNVPEILSQEINNVYNGGQYFRRLTLDINGQSRAFQINSAGPMPNQWYLDSITGLVTISSGTGMYANLEYGGSPIVWWDAGELGLVDPNDTWQFRGAKIEYHAYSQDSGTMIGTIYIANDSGDSNVSHIETSSGANDTGNVVLWNRYGNEQQLFAYRADLEDDTVKIHWTAQVYYGTESYGD